MPFQHRPRGRSAPLATGTPDAVTGFDETVPPGDDPAEDENAATPVSPEDEQPPAPDPATADEVPPGQHGPFADYR